MIFKQIITGFLMACADSVPGVSGGTIAYILGLYDKFISSIYNLTIKDKRVDAIKFLAVLGFGWIIGFIFAITIVTKLAQNHLYELSSLFLGFIFLSIFLTIRNEKNILRNNFKYLYISVIGILVVVIIAYLGTILTSSSEGLSVGLFSYIYLFIAGAAAVSCMLLPGISGSTIFLIFGVYYTITSAAKDFFSFELSALNILIPTGLGILFGAYFAVKVISHVFENHRAQTLYFINGLLIGSIYAIIVGPKSDGGVALNFSNFNVIWFVIGLLIIITIDRLNALFVSKETK